MSEKYITVKTLDDLAVLCDAKAAELENDAFNAILRREAIHYRGIAEGWRNAARLIRHSEIEK